MLSSCGVVLLAGIKSFRNCIGNVGQGGHIDFFTDFVFLSKEMIAEKNVSTVFPGILYNCFQCIPQKEAVSCRKYK